MNSTFDAAYLVDNIPLEKLYLGCQLRRSTVLARSSAGYEADACDRSYRGVAPLGSRYAIQKH
ncbi:hypothetical protein ABEW61_28675 [Paenibacillus amylolyticus]|uniref:hypothetical protein n=1 Tax=Paenibacillus amylolyticus TaxID=1451 RepID=UPI003D2E2C47